MKENLKLASLIGGQVVSVSDENELKGLIKSIIHLLDVDMNVDNILSDVKQNVFEEIACMGLKYSDGMFALYFFKKYPMSKGTCISGYGYAYNLYIPEFSECGYIPLLKHDGNWYC